MRSELSILAVVFAERCTRRNHAIPARCSPSSFDATPASVSGWGFQGPICLRVSEGQKRMLVINGRLHPRFIHYGASRKRRGGVGTRDNRTAVFAVSDGEVSFQEFGRLFRDDLKCRNALFLDGGSVPSLYVPSMKTGANFLRIGPMIAAFARARETPVP